MADGISVNDAEGCGTSATAVTSGEGVGAPEVSDNVLSATVMSADEVGGPGAAKVYTLKYNCFLNVD